VRNATEGINSCRPWVAPSEGGDEVILTVMEPTNIVPPAEEKGVVC
jgi:hypothetical protein